MPHPPRPSIKSVIRPVTDGLPSMRPFVITPDDEAVFAQPAWGGVLVGARGGVVHLVPMDAEAIALEAAPHQRIPIVVVAVLSTGTTEGLQLVGLGR